MDVMPGNGGADWDAVYTPPVRFPSEPEMTVDAALRLPALRRGAPEVLAGADQLHRHVRWAHSCEARHVSELLEGDEILLMTGMGLAGSAAGQRVFVRDLVKRHVAGLVIELGRVFTVMPAPLVQEARRLHLPLIALHEEVRFVEVTKQLHSAILTRQLAVERRGAELHNQLTAMLVDGAGVASILDGIAQAIGNPVLLERVSGVVLFHAGHGADDASLLADWELLRPRVDAGEPLAACAAVLASGGRVWGRLVAVPHERPIDGLARAAIDRTAPLIALALSRSGEELLLESRERGNFLQDVMADRIAPEDIAGRAAHLDLPAAREHRLLGLVAARREDRGGLAAALRDDRGGLAVPRRDDPLGFAAARRDNGGDLIAARRDDPAGHDDRRAPVALRDVRRALRGRGIASLAGTRQATDDIVMLLALPPGMTRVAAVEHAVAALHAAGLDAPGHTIAAGPVADSWAALPAALRAAADAAETMRYGPPRQWHDATLPDLDRLLWGLRGDDRLAAFAHQRLGPVLDHDRARSAILLPTLQALCDHDWQKAPAARELRIQRQSLYARIGRLRAVLGADLEDAETRLGLAIAVRALRVVGPEPPRV